MFIRIRSILIIFCILLPLVFSGCVKESPPSTVDLTIPSQQMDQPSMLPDWQDGIYHDYDATTALLQSFEAVYPHLVDVFSIGTSVRGKEIWCLGLTNENKTSSKYSCLIDGCIHGSEWEAGEACLYLAEYLLINFERNATLTHILNTTKLFIVPLVNPDGRQENEFGNANGVDLNRNFDIFFGKLRSPCLRLGKILSRLIGPVVRIPFLPVLFWPRNCGRYAFSEPETQAIRDLVTSFDRDAFSFYVNCHTAFHNIITPMPWSKLILKPPFSLQEKELQLFDTVKDWVEDNTEYEAERSTGSPIGGVATDWVFNEIRKPTFVFEILSRDYDPFEGEKKHDHLVHWMQTTIPVFMFMLVNIDNLRQWKTPDIEPSLPEGVPPPPLK